MNEKKSKWKEIEISKILKKVVKNFKHEQHEKLVNNCQT